VQLFAILQNVSEWSMSQVQDGDGATKKDSKIFDNTEIKRAAMTQPGLDQIFQGDVRRSEERNAIRPNRFEAVCTGKRRVQVNGRRGPSAGSFYQVGLMFDSQNGPSRVGVSASEPLVRRICNDSLVHCIIACKKHGESI